MSDNDNNNLVGWIGRLSCPLFNLDCYTLVSQGKLSSATGGLTIYMYNDFTFNILDLPNQLDNWEAEII